MNEAEKLLIQSNKDIDEHINILINQILILKTELDILNDWYSNKWLSLYKKYVGVTNKWKKWNSWIDKYILEPMRYQYCVYVRAFLDKLYVYLNKEHRDHKKNKDMWESSKYLKYYVNLIFKTGLYNKIYECEEEILEELIKLISFLSNPLHGFSIYFNKKYTSEDECIDENKTNKDMETNIDNIVTLILKRFINPDVIKIPINLDNKEEKQEYLNWTTHKILDHCEITNFLSFLEKYFLEDFNTSINDRKEWLDFLAKII